VSITLILIIVLISIVLGVGAFLVFLGLRNPKISDEETLTSRLEEFTRKGEEITLEKIELSQPFAERVIYPFARKFGKIAEKLAPANVVQSQQRKLELAGSPAQLDPTLVMASQFIVLLVFGGLIGLALFVGESRLPLWQKMTVTLVFSLLGFFFPQLWLSSKISKRQKLIRKAMPDALDLLTICVEAGLGFDSAIQKVSEKWESELSNMFSRVIHEIRLGKSRREALRDMAYNVDIPEMTSFVAAVIQSELLGVSLSKVLRIQSDQMRVRRRQIAEEEAHKAPLKMLIPMALLMFPSLMIVLLTPAAFRLMNSALGEMFR
jgi:tight adherence protein C